MNAEDKNDVKLKKFRREDLNKILEIEGQAFPKTPFPEEDFLVYAASLPEGFLVVESGKDIVGYIIFDMDGHILSMAVKPEHRRKGLGTTLFMHALRRAEKRLQLEVRPKNEGAIAFYRKLGMIIVGKIPNYYDDDDDAFVMVLDQERF